MKIMEPKLILPNVMNEIYTEELYGSSWPQQSSYTLDDSKTLSKCYGQGCLSCENTVSVLELRSDEQSQQNLAVESSAEKCELLKLVTKRVDEAWLNEVTDVHKLNLLREDVDLLDSMEKMPTFNALCNNSNKDCFKGTTTVEWMQNQSKKSNTPTLSAHEPDAHQNHTRSNRKAVACEICNRLFTNSYNLRIHMMIHKGELPFECDQCGKAFRQYSKLKIHQITHTNQKPFNCNICGKDFRHKNYLAIHKRLHNSSITQQLYKCRHCAERFHTLHERRIHETNAHASNLYNCAICQKVLTARCHLMAHIKRHINQRDFQCVHCEKRFFRRSQLKAHEVLHTSLKPFECAVCEMRFQRKSNYTNHMNVHAAVKGYICQLCGKAFAQSAGRNAHMKRHSKVEAEEEV